MLVVQTASQMPRFALSDNRGIINGGEGLRAFDLRYFALWGMQRQNGSGKLQYL
jgi:hypothetical protein